MVLPHKGRGNMLMLHISVCLGNRLFCNELYGYVKISHHIYMVILFLSCLLLRDSAGREFRPLVRRTMMEGHRSMPFLPFWQWDARGSGIVSSATGASRFRRTPGAFVLAVPQCAGMLPMPLFSSLSPSFRYFLFRPHRYFSCCASCGEIAAPRNRRLCFSLTPGFSVDLVVPRNAQGAAPCAAAFWPFGRVFAVLAPPERSPSPGEEESVGGGPPDTSFPPEELIHTLPELGEHYLVARSQAAVKGLQPADCFTANGIPLLPLKEESASVSDDLEQLFVFMAGQGLKAERRLALLEGWYAADSVAAADFLPFYKDFRASCPGSRLSYATLFAHWAYASGLAVPHAAPSPFLEGACACRC